MYELLTKVTKGVVNNVHKVVIRLSFGVIWQCKVSQGIGRFRHVFVQWLPKVS